MDWVDVDVDRELSESLQHAGLNSNYWIRIFKAKFPMIPCNEKDIKSAGAKIIGELKKLAKFKWEELALNEYFDLCDNGFEVQRLYSIEDRVKEGTIILDEIKKQKLTGTCRAFKPIKRREERMRHVLGIPKKYSITNYENISFADVISLYEFHIRELNVLKSNIEPEINNADLLQNSSNGLALKGILISQYVQDTQVKETILETPTCKLMPTKASCDLELEFISNSESKIFWDVLDKVGVSIATIAKDGDCKFKINSTEKSWGFKADDCPGIDHIYSKHSYSIIPTHTCKLEANELRLSRHAIKELKKFLVTAHPELLRKKCRDFLQRFGSHVIVGEVSFGGICGWQVSASVGGGANKKCVNGALIAFKSATNTGFGLGQTKWSSEGKIIGGPKDTQLIPPWNIGISLSNGTWAVVDRGGRGSEDIVGIWEIIRQEEEIKNAAELSDHLLEAWKEMFDVPRKAILRVGRRVSEWINVENTANYVIGCLCNLLTSFADSSKSAESEILQARSDEMVKRVIDEDINFTPQEVYQVRYLVWKLLNKRSHGGMDRDKMLKWVHFEKIDYGIPNLVQICSPENISTFLDIIERQFLPSIKLVLSEKTPKQLHHINIQISSELVLLVHQLQTHLGKCDQIRYLEFLQYALQEQLAYNSNKRLFDEIVTYDKLKAFLKETRQSWFRFTKTSLTYATQELSLSTLEDALNEDIAIRFGEQSKLSRPMVISDGAETKLLKYLGLTDYCHSKLSLRDVMTSGPDSPFYHAGMMLQKLIMANSTGRDEVIWISTEKNERDKISSSSEDGNSITDELASIIDSINATQSTEIVANTENGGTVEKMATVSNYDNETLPSDIANPNQIALNPQDINVAIFTCSDLMLRQTLVQKMFKCQLAVPFIFPLLTANSLMCSLWALRSIVMEWRKQDRETVECSLTEHMTTNIVSFVRFGDVHSLSKSKLMNFLISEHGHKNTFFDEDSPHSNTKREIANGVVEASWYLPSGKDTDIFDNVTMLLNLRGDATNYPKQLKVIMKLSCVIAVCIDIVDLSDKYVIAQLKAMHHFCKHVVLILVANDRSSVKPKVLRQMLLNYRQEVGNAIFEIGFDGKGVKNANHLKTKIKPIISDWIKTEKGTSIVDVCSYAQDVGIGVDEMDPYCYEGQQLSEKVCFFMETKNASSQKTKILPLQGKYWSEWCSLSKKHRKNQEKSEVDLLHAKYTLKKDMVSLRQHQLRSVRNLSPMMKTFISVLTQKKDEPVVTTFFLQWLKLYFDQQSRSSIPSLQRRYLTGKREYDAAKKSGNATEFRSTKTRLDQLEHELSVASFGLEHLMREIGQLYEAALESNLKLQSKSSNIIEQLPCIAANILLQGHPIEIMDGDTSTMPLTWIKAIFSSIIRIVGDKKVFVLSVIGIQSSGKSTLLNTMFGTEFSVSAGRCTRGVYINLVQVPSNHTSAKFDYILIVDTEGLRAPELNKVTYIHDNELATMVIGLGDITMINIKGENIVGIEDILQIAVHAFLRMKIVNKDFQLQQACVFLHQNVPSVTANDKMAYGTQILLNKLDHLTAEAAKLEDFTSISTFNQVILFDVDKYVWYFSDLWLGDPPMAPANPKYSEKVLEVRQYIVQEMTKKQQTFLTFSDLILRVEDLWNAVSAEDFVFSFRNSLAIKAYTILENKYNEYTWGIEDNIMEWLTKDALIKLQGCKSVQDLQQCCKKLTGIMENKVKELLKKARSDLKNFIISSNHKDILVQWSDAKLMSLNTAVTSIRNQVEADIMDQMESLRFELEQKERQTQHEQEITKKARDLADKISREQPTEAKLRETFNVVWQEWVKDIGASMPAESVSIYTLVEDLLLTRLPKHHVLLQRELKLQELSKPLDDHENNCLKEEDISSEFISVPMDTHNSTPDYKKQAFKKAKELLQKVDDNLNELRDQRTKFVMSNATTVMRIIMDGVDEHNQTHYGKFTLLPNFTIKLVVHACRHGIFVFNQMQTDYQQMHGIQQKLEACKNTFWNYFKNLVVQSTTEVIVADLICDKIEERIKLDVLKRIPAKIVQHISATHKSKKDLVISVLKSLAEKDNFDSYVHYLDNAKSYALEWLSMETNKVFFGESGQTWYASLAEKHIEKITSGMIKCSEEATELVKQQPEVSQEMANWIDLFCDKMTKEISLPKKDLQQVFEHTVTDFDNLHRLLIARLPSLEKNALAPFKETTAENIIWEGTTPYQQIIARLWGCAEQCPFCKEPCERSDSNHVPSVSHRCIQHRPQGVGGLQWVNTAKLCIENCCYLVQTEDKQFSCGACGNHCQRSGKCTGERGSLHNYKDYKTYVPDWDIAPSASMEHSDYWKWFMVTYRYELANRHLCNLPDIPDIWTDITLDQACTSLDKH